ncbi:MAG: hypothetical protein Q4E12_01180, partial [Coriobacteriia bacterium]|nr:hypothetical protein [Coriobacteriia bacterium]
GGLRLRQENDASVCCLKLSADAGYGFKQRQEFEVSAPTIREGLQALPGAGAPADVCAQLLAEGVQETCYTHFTRQATLVQWREGEASVTAELAFDQGTLGHSTASAPLREVELEYKDGSVELFHTLAARLEDNLHLVPQPLSKLARALGA